MQNLNIYYNFHIFFSYLVSGDADGKCYIWDWKTTKLYKKWKAHDNVCISVLWHPHEPSKLMTAGWDGLIKYWDQAFQDFFCFIKRLIVSSCKLYLIIFKLLQIKFKLEVSKFIFCLQEVDDFLIAVLVLLSMFQQLPQTWKMEHYKITSNFTVYFKIKFHKFQCMVLK